MFHDTLPGSSIRLAVEDYEQAFKEIHATGNEIRDSALKALQAKSKSLNTGRIINTLPGVARSECIEIEGQVRVVEAEAGQLLASVSSDSFDEGVSGECKSRITSAEYGLKCK